MKNFRVELTNWAHALATYIGALIAAAGGAATVATFFGAHINSLPSLQGNGVAGLILTIASKFIDSANDSVNTATAPTPLTTVVAPPRPAPLPVSPPPVASPTQTPAPLG